MSLVSRICLQCRFKSTSLPGAASVVANNELSKTFVNNNPRNLEKMRIGYKPDGYHLEKPGRIYWHKLLLRESHRNVTATVDHHENGTVLKACTSEWCIREQLYNTKDTNAYYNLGRVLAERCLMSGITEMYCNIQPNNPNGRVAHFLNAFKESGVTLTEPPQYKPARPWDQYRLEKPWEVTE